MAHVDPLERDDAGPSISKARSLINHTARCVGHLVFVSGHFTFDALLIGIDRCLIALTLRHIWVSLVACVNTATMGRLELSSDWDTARLYSAGPI
jgi:hypothetical protein